MEQIKLRNISKEILNAEHLDTYEDLKYLIAEATATKALAFFNISFDETRDILEVPDVFDIDEAIEVVNLYLSYQEEDIATYSDRARQYDEHTKPTRGADDGTFDYAGTFVISILSVLQAHFKK